MRRGEEGVAVVVTLSLVALLVLVGGVCSAAVALVAAHRQAQSAADLAALAGAAAAGSGKAACAEVAAVAEQNGVEVRHCDTDGGDVLVVVERRLAGILAAPPVQARARAGPAAAR